MIKKAEQKSHKKYQELLEKHERHEKELFDSKQRLEALMNALPVAVSFSTDTTCEYITGNPALIKYLEINPGDNISVTSNMDLSLGKKLKHYIHGKPIPPEEMPLQKSIKENKLVGPMEIEIRLPSGKRRLVEAFGAPIRDQDGNVIAAVAVNVDLTERKRAEEATRLEKLMEQEKLKIDFVTDATHELRTPLAIIKGHVDLALRSDKLSSATKESLNAINSEIIFLANMLSDLSLLTTSKDSGEKRKAGFKNIELSGLLLRTVKRYEEFAKRKNIKFVIGKLNGTQIKGDEAYLERLFSNIITNAISYGKENGSVWINTKKTAKEIRIEIKDDGIGIPQKDLPHIFERFYRVDSSRSKDSGGTGLGLAIVKWITEAHGGKVSATSLEKKGTTLSVTFPLSKSK